MKAINFLVILMLLSVPTLSNAEKSKLENRFYYGFGEKIEIRQVNEKILVKTKPSVAKTRYEQFLKSRMSVAKTSWQGENLCTIELSTTDNVDEKIKELLADDGVVSVRNCYKTGDGFEFGLSDEIIVRFKERVKDVDKEAILKKYGLQKIKSTKIYESYSLSMDKDVITVANELYESGLFEFDMPSRISRDTQ